jgi:hypothetical protein
MVGGRLGLPGAVASGAEDLLSRLIGMRLPSLLAGLGYSMGLIPEARGFCVKPHLLVKGSGCSPFTLSPFFSNSEVSREAFSSVQQYLYRLTLWDEVYGEVATKPASRWQSKFT